MKTKKVKYVSTAHYLQGAKDMIQLTLLSWNGTSDPQLYHPNLYLIENNKFLERTLRKVYRVSL